MLNLDVTKKYALAVSGGVDSMVMLHAFAHHLPRPNFFVVTINHNIRKEGKADCQFVADFCAKLGVECQIFDVDAPTHAQQNKLSLETSARVLRYEILSGLDCDYVCLAHHQRDNVETVLLHLIRGSGTKGLQGIKQYNGKYFRPLLNVAKQQIDDYAKQHKIPFVVDSTNSDDNYARNYIRNKILPLLKNLNQAFEQNVERLTKILAQEEELLNEILPFEKVIFDQDSAKIPIELLRDTAQGCKILKKTFEKLGVFADVEYRHYLAVCQLANNVGGKRLNLPFDYVAINDYDFVTICKQESAHTENNWQITFGVGVTVTPLGRVEVSQTSTDNALRFDVTKISPTAVFRTRRSGDVFCKFGGGTKLLKDYLIDKKIPQRERDNLVLLADGQNILAILNVEIAESIKVTNPDHTYYINFSKE